MEVRSDQVDDVVAFVKRKIGEFAYRDWIINCECGIEGSAVSGVNQKLVVGLVKKNCTVTASDFFSVALVKVSKSQEGVQLVGDVDFVDDKISRTLSVNGNPHSVDVEFNDLSKLIFSETEELVIDLGVDGEIIDEKLVVSCIITDDQNKVSEDVSGGSNFLDQNDVLIGIDENDWIGSFENDFGGFQVLVKNGNLNFTVFV